jgi:hypothetical protein
MGILLFCLLLGIQISGDNRGAATANAETVYLMRNSVIGAAGSPGGSTHYSTNGTLGQPTPIGIGSADDLTLYAGFWGRYWIPTGTDEIPILYSIMLHQNFPNPFNPVTTIEYSLAHSGPVEIAIFDVTGRRIAMLVNEDSAAGKYRSTWNGKNENGQHVASGIYFCRMVADSKTIVKKMILLR